MEAWDVLDKNRQPLGRTILRGEKDLKQGEFHAAAQVCVVNSKNELLVTLRDERKIDFPGKWECTSGSLLAGETSLQGIIRELFEETGITSDGDQFMFLGTVTEPDCFLDIYLLRQDVDIDALVLQDGETTDAKWVSFSTYDDMVKDGSFASIVAERIECFRDKLVSYLIIDKL